MATVVKKTLGPVGCDYTSLSNLEAANADLVALDQAWEVECENFQDSVGSTITWGGWVTSPTCYLKVYAKDKHGSGGRITTNAYRVVSTPLCITIGNIGAGGLMIFEGIQWDAQSVMSVGAISDGGGATVRFKNCIMDCDYRCFANTQSAGCHYQLINCFCITRTYNASYPRLYTNDKTKTEFYNSTLIYLGTTNEALYLSTHATTKVLKNCYVCAPNNGGTVTISGTNVTKTKCATDDTSGDVQNIPYSADNFVNVGSGTEDLHLVSTSVLVGAGASIEGQPAPFDYTTDVNGDARNIDTPDIGADEELPYVAISPDAARGLMLSYTEAGTIESWNSADDASDPRPQNYLDAGQIMRRVRRSNGEYRTVRV